LWILKKRHFYIYFYTSLLIFLIKLDIHLQSIVDTAQIENGYVWSGILALCILCSVCICLLFKNGCETVCIMQ